jgi:hypothetical protein
MYEMGFVYIEILYKYNEDYGEYVWRDVNDMGEDKKREKILWKKLKKIIIKNKVKKGMKKYEELMKMEENIKKYK